MLIWTAEKNINNIFQIESEPHGLKCECNQMRQTLTTSNPEKQMSDRGEKATIIASQRVDGKRSDHWKQIMQKDISTDQI